MLDREPAPRYLPNGVRSAEPSGRGSLPAESDSGLPIFGLDLPPVERLSRPPESPAVESGGSVSGCTELSPSPEEPVIGAPDRGAAMRAEEPPTDLSARAEAIVTRWNPHGMALLLAMRSTACARDTRVALLGDDEVQIALLRAELARWAPRVEFPAAESSRAPRRPAAVACVVLDAGAPIGREMLGAVRRLRGEGTRIVFALAGFDAHREWRAVLERDAELLSPGEHGPLTPGSATTPAAGPPVEIIPVSVRMAVVARASGDAALGDRAGIGLLHARLVAAVGAGAAGDQAALVRERVVRETRARIEGELAKLRTGGDVAALRAERATLLAVNDGGRGTAMAMLRNRLHLARVDLLHEAGVRIRALNAAARTEIDRLPYTAHAGYPRGLQISVEKITREIDRAIHARLTEVDELIEKAVRASELAGGTPDSTALPALAWRDRPPRVGPDPEPRCRGVEDHLMIALGASAGFGLGRLLVIPLSWWAAAEYAIVPVGLVLGALAASWVVRGRRQLAERAHLRQWMTDALVNVKAQWEQRIATAIVEAEERLTERVLRASTARMVETDRRVGELEAQLRQAAQRRPALTTACERDLTALDFA
ncbi:hypothetical protein [Nocardia acidivorans]|uniref:hypothetical protein n=1 Tax=Nocardia acidivorans TaxID=404580 RepID=UPI000AC35BF9|nr:hypothetical protein [Nocardia acidivorans]